jgi:hypothetical protein
VVIPVPDHEITESAVLASRKPMTEIPKFPVFRPIQLGDRDIIKKILDGYQPQTSEWTFTNLFIWRSHYGFQWSLYRDWLIVLSNTDRHPEYLLGPIGPPPRLDPTRMLLEWLRDEKGIAAARIERADQRTVSEIGGAKGFVIEPTRDQFDYVYRSEDLVNLAGRKYHSKRNHINKLTRSYSFTYAPLLDDHLKACLDLADTWCEWHRCEEDLNLIGEWDAVRESLANYQVLGIKGGVILIEDQVKAFALGELLNPQVAIVHIEKADPEIPGLYSLINQQFCEHHFQDVAFINREQDLGEPGLRKAKLSYYPDHLVEKFRIGLTV